MSVSLGLMRLHHPKSGLPNNHCSAIVFRLGPGGLFRFERWEVVRSKLAGYLSKRLLEKKVDEV